MPRPPLLLLFLIALVTLPLAGARASDPVDDQAVADFGRAHPDEPVLVLDDWTRLDVEYDAKDDGIRGAMHYGHEYWVRSPAGIEDAALIYAFDSPRIQLDKVRIEVTTRGGKRRKLDDGDLRWVSHTSQDGLVIELDQLTRRALIPGVAVGDRIRVEQSYDLKFIHGVPTTSFGGRWPCLRSSLELTAPNDHELIFSQLGPPKLIERLSHEEVSSRREVTHRWEIWNLPRRRQDAYSAQSASIRLTPHFAAVGKPLAETAFAAGPDWTAVGEGYWRRIDELLAVTPELEDLASEIVGDRQDVREQIDALYRYVQNNCRYLGLYEGLDGIIPETASDVRKNGYGDCKGLGTLLIVLLRARGIDAHPVLLRTGHIGLLDTAVPNMAQFNHYIAWADDGEGGIFLDGTMKGCPAGTVSVPNAASPVLLLRPGHTGLHSIPRKAWTPGVRRLEVAGSLSRDGHMQLSIDEHSERSLAMRRRASVLSRSPRQQEQDLVNLLLPTSLPMDVEDVSLGSLDRWEGPLLCSLECSTRKPLPRGRDRLFLPKTLLSLDLEGLTRGRSSPLDLRSLPAVEENWKLALPGAMQMAGVDSFSITAPGLKYSRRAWQEGEELRLERRIEWTELTLSLEEARDMATALKEVQAAEAGHFSLRLSSR